MSSVLAQPDRDLVMDDLIDALRVFTVESDAFVDVFARAHGLGRSDLNAIMWISMGTTSGEPMTIGELAQRLGLSPAATTALVDRLENTGHVSRLPDPANRRRVTIRIHDRALRLASAFFAPLGTDAPGHRRLQRTRPRPDRHHRASAHRGAPRCPGRRRQRVRQATASRHLRAEQSYTAPVLPGKQEKGNAIMPARLSAYERMCTAIHT